MIARTGALLAGAVGGVALAQAPSVAATTAHEASSSPVLVNEGWQVFEWGLAGRGDPSFSFTTRRAVRVSVTDAACRGDAFTVQADGEVVLVTPSVPPDGCDGDQVLGPDAAWRDPSYSHGSTVLRPGTYTIAVLVTDNPYGEGDAYIRFDSPPRPFR